MSDSARRDWGQDPDKAAQCALAHPMVPEADLRAAAEQRALAMDYSDRWVDQGRDPIAACQLLHIARVKQDSAGAAK